MMVERKAYSITTQKNTDYSFLSILISTISITIGILSINGNAQGTIYKYIFVLPILFGILNLAFFKVYRNFTLSSALVLGFMLIRYVVTPLVLYLENYPISIYRTENTEASKVYAIFAMSYEMFMIFLAISRKKRAMNTISDEDYIAKVISKENFGQIGFTCLIIIGFTFAIFAVFPTLFNNYSFIVNSDLDRLIASAESQQANLPFGMRWIGYTLGEATRYIVIEYILIKLFKSYEKSEHGFYWWVSIFIITANACITTSRIMVGLLMSISLYYQTYKLYPKMRRFFLRTGIGLGIIAILIIAYTYLSNVLRYHSLSQMIQGYTNGFYNVYQARNAYLNYRQDFFEKVSMFFLGDGLGNVNIISRFFHSINSSDIYNYYIYNSVFNGGAVVPLVSQMSYYFSIVFGPIITYFTMRIMNHYEVRTQNGNGNLLLNQFMAVTLGTMPFMYNYSTLLHIVTVVVVPIWLLSWVNGHVTIGTR